MTSMVLLKYAVTALIVVLVSELTKSHVRVGAVVGALPLVTIMVMVWMHVEREDVTKIASYATFTFWYVIPTLPMFLLTPSLLHRGFGFATSLGAGLALTLACFGLTILVAQRFGVNLWGA